LLNSKQISRPAYGRYRAITNKTVMDTPQWAALPKELQESLRVVSAVLPFRTNRYVMDELIDWEEPLDDPMFTLNFVQRDMLAPKHYGAMAELLGRGAPETEIKALADRIRLSLNPHPAGQMTHNVPMLDGRPVAGVQHKYRQTVLFFPSQGQTCHAYCTFCFRWAQFIGSKELKFQAGETRELYEYLSRHREVSDLLLTGGDPLIMRTSALSSYLGPLLEDAGGRLEHVETVRIGTKSVAYWPQRFVSDPDADELLELFERIVASGRHLAIMGHYNHPRELSTPIAQEALRRIRNTGATIRMQSPLLRGINDDAKTWSELWKTGVNLGVVPYYMFVERDTGPKAFFEVPLVRAWEIFQQAYQEVSGLARTVRGPSMSSLHGKVALDGVAEVRGERVLCLQFLQARNPDWVRRPFFAEYDENASWLGDLRPAFGEDSFFFEEAAPRGVVRLRQVGQV
jgi:KamA family protein